MNVSVDVLVLDPATFTSTSTLTTAQLAAQIRLAGFSIKLPAPNSQAR
ncbi:MAG: hypothetical protein KDH09_02920 [Chrysiogenetes bacterium]|nr:hypothetical protein [Chrysiogenetes bacterium]